MTFIHPLFLWALLAVAVPVIIHLFNFRKYKKVYFTNVKFLKELQEESKSKSRLRELLILLCRCLALACLVLAFCQPVILNKASQATQAAPHAIGLYIDNSFSMQNVNAQGPVFDIARQRAKEVVKAYGSADRFQLLTNDFEGKHQRLLSREDALSAIDELKVSSSVRLLSDVLRRQQEFLSATAAPNKKMYVFSDAQQSTFNLASCQPDTNIKIRLLPLKTNQVNNVFVDSCWFQSPIQQTGFIQKLHAKIKNTGNRPLDIGSAKLFLNKQQVALASFSVEANASAEVLFTFECKSNGFNFGSIKIEDYPVTFDDELFFAFNSQLNIRVNLINGKGQPATNAFAALFAGDSIFKLSTLNEQAIDYKLFQQSDVIILNQLSELSSGLISELNKFSMQGGALVIVPPTNANLANYNTALKLFALPNLGLLDSVAVKTNSIETASGFFTGVFEKTDNNINLPLVSKHYKLQKSNRNNVDNIFTLQNGETFLGQKQLNNATLYLFTSPLNENATNFSRHTLFVPTLYRLCFMAIKAMPLFYPVSSNVVINLKNAGEAGEQPPHISQPDGSADMIPEMRVINNTCALYTRNQVSSPGFYQVSRNGKALLPLAFNYLRKESELKAYTYEELENICLDKNLRSVSLLEDTGEDISKQVMQAEGGKKLWKLFILLALGFLLIETLLLRLLK